MEEYDIWRDQMAEVKNGEAIEPCAYEDNELAKAAWDYQQKRIDELEQTLSRVEGIEDEYLGGAD